MEETGAPAVPPQLAVRWGHPLPVPSAALTAAY